MAAKQEDALLALGCAERMRSRALSDQLSWRKVDMAVRLPKKLQKQFDDLREQRKQVYALLQQTTGLPTDTEEDQTRGAYIPIRGVYIPIRGPLDQAQKVTPEDEKRLKSLLQDLAKQEAALESVVREAVPAYRMASQPQIPTETQLIQSARLIRGCAVLEYTLTDEGVVGVAVAPGFHPFVKLLPVKREELSDGIVRFRQSLQERDAKIKACTQSFYKFLVTPFEPVLGNTKQLLIVADGALQLIPFAALQNENGKYLAERFSISYAPSLTLAVSQRGDRGTVKPVPTSALIVAAPDTGAFDETPEPLTTQPPTTNTDRGIYIPIRGYYIPIRGEGGWSSQLDSMAMVALPGAKTEGEAVAKQFTGSTLLTGKDATKDRLLTEGSKCDILHIATHGYADPEVPEFSGLLLAGKEDLTQSRQGAKADGGTTESAPTDLGMGYDVLTAEEVFLWNLNAKLVTLSACETGLGKDVEGEGVLGLTRAFLYAGAREVLCSLWSVSDESTSTLMQTFYTQLQKGQSVDASLQFAQQTLLKDRKTSHPFYWAAFVNVKGPR